MARDRRLLHVTEEKSLAAILRDGLRPAIETGNSAPTDYGLISDPNFVYLWSDPRKAVLCVNLRPEMHIIGVDLHPEHPIERDYSLFTFPIKMSPDHLGLLGYSSPSDFLDRKFKESGINFSGDYSAENIKALVDQIPTMLWERFNPSYRTAVAIPVQNLMLLI